MDFRNLQFTALQTQTSESVRRSYLSNTYTSSPDTFSTRSQAKDLCSPVPLPFLVIFQSIQISRLNSELSRLRDPNTTDRCDYLARDSKIVSLQRDRQTYSEQNQKLNMVCQQLYGELEEMKRRGLTGDSDQFADRYQKERARNIDLQMELDTWRARYEACERGRAKEVQEVRGTVDAMRKSMIDREVREMAIKNQNQRAALENQIRKLRDCLEAKSKELEDSRARFGLYEAELTAMNTNQNKLEEFENKLAMISQEMMRLNELVKVKQEEIDAGKGRQRQLEQKIQEQQRWQLEIKQLQTTLEIKIRSLSQLQQKCTRQQCSLSQLTSQNTQLSSQLTQLSTQNSQLSLKLTSVQQHLQLTCSNLTSKYSQVQQLKRTLSDCSESNRTLQRKISNYQNKIALLTNQLQRISVVNREKMGELQEWKAKHKVLQETISSYTEYERQNRELSERLGQQFRILEDVKVRLERTEGELSAMRSYQRKAKEQEEVVRGYERRVREQEEFVRIYQRKANEQDQIARGYQRKVKEQEELVRNCERKNKEQEEVMRSCERRNKEQQEVLRNYDRKVKEQEQAMRWKVKEQEDVMRNYERRVKEQQESLRICQRKIKQHQEISRNYQRKAKDQDQQTRVLSFQIQKVNNILRAKQQQVQEAKSKQTKLQNIVAQTKQAQSRLRDYENKINELSQQLERMNNVVRNKNQQLQRSISAIQQLQSQLSSMRSFQPLLIQSKKSLQTLSSNLDTHKRQSLKLQSTLRQSQSHCKQLQSSNFSLLQQRDKLANTLRVKTFELEEIRSKYSKLESDSFRAREMETSFYDLQNKTMTMETEISRYERSWKNMEEELNKEKNLGLELAFKVIVLSAEIERYQSSGGIRAKDFVEMQEKIHCLQTGMRDRDNQLNLLMQKISGLEPKIGYLMGQLERYLDALTANDRKIHQLEQEIAQYQQQIKRFMAISAEVDQAISENKATTITTQKKFQTRKKVLEPIHNEEVYYRRY